MEMWDKEALFHEKIEPLLQQAINVAKAHGIPVICYANSYVKEEGAMMHQFVNLPKESFHYLFLLRALVRSPNFKDLLEIIEPLLELEAALALSDQVEYPHGHC